jgi:hypothetical protein
LQRVRIEGAAFGVRPVAEGLFVLALVPETFKIKTRSPGDRRGHSTTVTVEADRDRLRRSVLEPVGFFDFAKPAAQHLTH